MNNNFINCFSAEWIKRRRSFASWLVLAGGFFVPVISTLIFIVYPKQLIAIHATGNFWSLLFQKSWQMMAFMLLPMGMVLAVSLLAQIEFKNNGWKQVHSTPVPLSSIFFSKLAVLVLMLMQLFLLFNIGIYLSAVIPSLVNSNIPFPRYAIDLSYIMRENSNYFIACLPVLALQFTLSLQFKNFLIPIGAGLAFTIGALIALSWKYIYIIPYSYTALHFLHAKDHTQQQHNLLLWALGYFVLFISIGYWLFISKKEKG